MWNPLSKNRDSFRVAMAAMPHSHAPGSRAMHQVEAQRIAATIGTLGGVADIKVELIDNERLIRTGIAFPE